MKYVSDSNLSSFTNKFKAWVKDLVNGKKIKNTDIDSTGATSGQALMANGSNGASWSSVNDVFWCTYNTTLYADITAALAAGKIPVCVYGSYTYIYTILYTGNYYGFVAWGSNGMNRVWITPENVWHATYSIVEETSHKVTSISASSTDTQYPSAKCVYDNLLLKQDVLPSGTSGQLLAAGSGGPYFTNNLPVLTTAPTANNTDGGLKIVVLPTDPVTKYTGYLYIILDTTPVSYSQSGNVLTVVDAPLVQDGETVTTI